MKKQRWRFTKPKWAICCECGTKFDRREYDFYGNCSVSCNLYSVGMSWDDFI